MVARRGKRSAAQTKARDRKRQTYFKGAYCLKEFVSESEDGDTGGRASTDGANEKSHGENGGNGCASSGSGGQSSTGGSADISATATAAYNDLLKPWGTK